MFSPVNPLDDVALDAGRALVKSLPNLPVGGSLQRIYLHWTAAEYNQTFTDYNGMVILKDGKWQFVMTHDPITNATASPDRAMHTYMRNSYAFGISIGAMAEATPSNFGDAPLQEHELEMLCACAAAVADKYNIDTIGKVTESGHDGEYNILTHAECAIIDDYFPGDNDPDSRWDLALFVPGTLTKDGAVAHGDLLRSRIHQYKLKFG